MLSPVREDTLGYHANQLKLLGYPFAVLLVINLTCVLYAISRTPAAREMPASVPAAVDSAVVSAPGEVSLPEVAQQDESTAVIGKTWISDQATQIVQDGQHRLGSGEIETVSYPTRGSQLGRWLSEWVDRVAAWQAEQNADDNASKTEAEVATEPASTSLATTRGRRDLIVRNPASNRGLVSFLANGKRVALEAGESLYMGIGDEEQHTIRFHRGGTFGNAAHILDGGEYYFVVTNKGWTLLEGETSDAH